MNIVISSLGSRGDIQPYLALAVGLQLAEYRDGLLRVSGGTLQHSESIQLGDSPGLDFTVTLPKSAKHPQGIVDHARVYLVDGRVYGLDFISRFSMAEAPEVNQFFDSFQVVPRDK